MKNGVPWQVAMEEEMQIASDAEVYAYAVHFAEMEQPGHFDWSRGQWIPHNA